MIISVGLHFKRKNELYPGGVHDSVGPSRVSASAEKRGHHGGEALPGGDRRCVEARTAPVMGNHLSDNTCLTQVFFKFDE